MYSVLKAPNNVSKSKMVKSVYSKCIGIKEKLSNYDETKFLNSLKYEFEQVLGFKLENGSFSEYELKLAEKLIKKKYSKINWLEKYK